MKVQNKHKVPKSQFKKWSPRAQETFNSLFEYMVKNQPFFSHPKAETSRDHYATTAWNAAWTAADIVDGRF